MFPILPALILFACSYQFPAQTFYVQVAPAPRAAAEAFRSPDQACAVVLIHGLKVHPFDHHNVAKAVLHEWQKPASLLVKRLAKDCDVYSFAYAQDVPIEDIAAGPGLAQCIGRVRSMGYRSIVLIGHSAGGLIAREFVEDTPDCGVAKVIQVCAPNGGSSWAEWRAVLHSQSAFLYSMTKEARKVILRGRSDRKIPPSIQFACVIGNGMGTGDGLVLCKSQWTDDLQNQGIPAYSVATTHWLVPRIKIGVDLLVDLVHQDQPRWSPRTVAVVRKQLLHE